MYNEFEILKWVERCVRNGEKKINNSSCRFPVVDIGDDAAVILTANNKYACVTTDSLVEGIHFLRSELSPFAIGAKAVKRAVSDMAAMGCAGSVMTVNLICPKNLETGYFKRLYSGVIKTAELYGIRLIGGDITIGKKLPMSLSVVVTDFINGGFVKRSGAQIGDLICVTGTLGGAAAGKHYKFIPRTKEVSLLKSAVKINSMIDISDGLAVDLCRLAEASGVGANLCGKRIPLSNAALKLAKNNKVKALYMALNDGEDYELLFTTPSFSGEKVGKKVIVHSNGVKLPVFVIGEIARSDKVTIRMPDGKLKDLSKYSGYLHSFGG